MIEFAVLLYVAGVPKRVRRLCFMKRVELEKLQFDLVAAIWNSINC